MQGISSTSNSNGLSISTSFKFAYGVFHQHALLLLGAASIFTILERGISGSSALLLPLQALGQQTSAWLIFIVQLILSPVFSAGFIQILLLIHAGRPCRIADILGKDSGRTKAKKLGSLLCLPIVGVAKIIFFCFFGVGVICAGPLLFGQWLFKTFPICRSIAPYGLALLNFAALLMFLGVAKDEIVNLILAPFYIVERGMGPLCALKQKQRLREKAPWRLLLLAISFFTFPLALRLLAIAVTSLGVISRITWDDIGYGRISPLSTYVADFSMWTTVVFFSLVSTDVYCQLTYAQESGIMPESGDSAQQVTS